MSHLPELPATEPLSAGGSRLATRCLGSGPRAVILHGGPGLDHHTVLPLGLSLAERFEVLLPDLPGHGRSHQRGAGLPDLRGVYDRTAPWLHGLEADLLIGHSLGAWLLCQALALGGVRPPRAVVLIAPPTAQPRRPPSRVERSWIGRRAAIRGRQAPLVRELLELCEEEAGQALDPLFVESIHRAKLVHARNYHALLAQMRRLLGEPLRRFDPGCPLLVLSGDRDDVCPPNQAEAMTARIEGARYLRLDDTGHFPFSTDPQRVANRIGAFFAAVNDARR